MIKSKIIPIIIACFLVFIVFIIIGINVINDKKYEKLIISYQNENIDHTALEVDNVFVINNISFWVVSTSKNLIIVNSSENVSYNDKEINEIELKLNKSKEICFKNGTCALLELK